jgi:carbonic anhydrase/acetyltransferase-like protein (isoleucine patch superfamily)
MIRSFEGKTPRIHPTAFIAETAYIVGDVEIGAGSSVWPGAVIRADYAPIRIGSGTHIEDNAVVHASMPLEIGNDVTIGHGVVIHCRRIGDRALIGNNATVLDGAEVGEAAMVAAGAVVTPRTVIPPGAFAAGVPAEVRGDVTQTSRGRNRDVLGGGRPGGIGYDALIRRYRAEGLDANAPPEAP